MGFLAVSRLIAFLVALLVGACAHATEPYAQYCLTPTGWGLPLSTQDVMGNIIQWYDRDHNGQADAATVTHRLTNGQPRPFPSSYFLRDDTSEYGTRWYLDVNQNGRCEDLREMDMSQEEKSTWLESEPGPGLALQR